MHIIGAEKLNAFAQRHPNARSALNRWFRLIDEGTFRSIVELRETFPHADPVPARSGLYTLHNKYISYPRLLKIVHVLIYFGINQKPS